MNQPTNTTSLTKNDYIISVRAFFWSNLQIFGLLAFLFLFFDFQICLALLNGTTIIFDYGSIFFLVILLALSLSFLIGLVVNPLITEKVVDKNKLYYMSIQYEFDNEKILLKNETAEVEMPWSRFQKCIETQDLFLLVYSNKKAFDIIPKRILVSVENESFFRKLLADKHLTRHNTILRFSDNSKFILSIIWIFGIYLFSFIILVIYPYYNTYIR
jgi:hypothetical protein